MRVLDGGTEPVPYVVMEYIGGGDLREEMAERGSLTIEATIEVGRGVFDALRVLDEAGIIHRDIKPANVMRDLDGTVKLTDFGIAKIIGYDTITATGQLPLSMAYAAPESWDGRSSHRSDLYSVGVLLYQCLVGEAPFGGTYAEVYRQHLSQRPDLTRLPGATPPSLRSLIARCLEKEVEARPADATACMQLIDAAASELVDSTDPRGPRHPTRLGPWVIIDHHFEFLRPRDELVQVVAGAAPGLAALSIGERIEIFVVNARGATLEEYAAGALTNVTVDRERLASLDGLPAVVLEYHPQPGSATEAATFLLRDDAAHVFIFRRGATVEGCASDLATYRMLLRSFRFLGDPDAAPTLLPGPDAAPLVPLPRRP